jgi:hypothetical protein
VLDGEDIALNEDALDSDGIALGDDGALGEDVDEDSRELDNGVAEDRCVKDDGRGLLLEVQVLVLELEEGSTRLGVADEADEGLLALDDRDIDDGA